jgi:hypothetical protein
MMKIRHFLWLMCSFAFAFNVVSDASGQSGGETSSLIYPIQKNTLRVNHLHPAHQSLACERCHLSSRKSRSEKDRLLPPESACQPCHADRLDREKTSAKQCGFCHRGYDPAISSAISIADLPTPRIHFSHARHVNNKIGCIDCHGAGLRDDNALRDRLPDMRRCSSCHKPEEEGNCPKCHLTDPAGIMRTRYGDGNLTPPSWLLGMQHDREWVVRHRWIGADRGNVCSACHKENDCTACHDGRRRPSTIHPNDWLTLHAQRSRRNTPRCTSCHTTQTFCTECHYRLGVALNASPNIRSDRRFHPPKNEWIQGPMLHAREAKRSLSSCTSCHAQSDCVLCHGSRGVGQGISPHPKGFDKICGKLLEKNNRACRVCHQDIRALSDRCQK